MRDKQSHKGKKGLLSRRTMVSAKTPHQHDCEAKWAFLFSFVCTRQSGSVGSVLSLLAISLRNSAESLHKETLPAQNREWNTQLNYAMEHTLLVEHRLNWGIYSAIHFENNAKELRLRNIVTSTTKDWKLCSLQISNCVFTKWSFWGFTLGVIADLRGCLGIKESTIKYTLLA